MIYEALNDNMMLVELSPEEMQKYRITYETIEKDEKTARNAIKTILSRTDAADRLQKGAKVTVEALPVPNGGCFFIFTFAEKKTRYKVKKEAFSVFETESLDNLLDFISAIRKTDENKGKCKAYKMNGGYFLSVPSDLTKVIHLMGEYGKRSNVDTYRLSEYGKLLGNVYLQ